jgi:two-component system cell cycle response regulator
MQSRLLYRLSLENTQTRVTTLSLLPASSSVDLRRLRLNDARALLEHSGQSLPTEQTDATQFLQTVIDRLSELSLKDPLTGLSNRRYFQGILSREIEMVARSGESSFLLMLDIDQFKIVNDQYGHPTGDIVLQTVAKTLSACVRPMDTVARFGGDEFVIILSNCQGHYGQQVAERILEAVSALKIELTSGVTLRVTVSVGGAFAPRWIRSTPELWIDRADIALYRAKSEGRNRVCIEAQPVLAVSAEEKSLLFSPLSMGDPAWIESIANDGSTGQSDGVATEIN